MAALTSTIIAGVGAVTSGIQAYQGYRNKQKAEQAADKAAKDYLSIEEQNKMEGLRVPTEAADLQRQMLEQQQTQQLSQLSGAGMEALLGGIGQVAQVGAQSSQEISADLANRMYERDAAVAANEQAIAQRKAQREEAVANARLYGAQAAAAQGETQMQQGITGMVSGLATAGSEYIKSRPLYGKGTPTLGGIGMMGGAPGVDLMPSPITSVVDYNKRLLK